MLIEKLCKIRNYMMQEEYKKDILTYMIEIATQNIGRNGNFQDGMLYMIDQIKKIPEKVDRAK